ncbi:hypothetical protein [Paraburkholderia flava]|uniref:hypothetical protein n=1 Tax=Paraburkholderia flava TaxID=2547393 RepID=UPI00105BCF0C|nr:hypothetical protein [Paraburkholderia flava]
MQSIENNTVVRLRASGLRMTVKTQNPDAARFGKDFVFCESVVKGKHEHGYFRRDQLVVLRHSVEQVMSDFT